MPGTDQKRGENKIRDDQDSIFCDNRNYSLSGIFTSDLGVQRRDIGTVRMSEALQALLYSQEGNLTVAMPSCSFMDITMPTLPSTPLPTTWGTDE